MRDAAPKLRAFDRIADRIKAHRQVDRRFVVVVEGESDQRVIEALLNESTVKVFRGCSRTAVLEVAQDLDPLGITEIACVVDRDFDQEVAKAEARGLPVVAYDGADLEDMLMSSPAATRMIKELASESKLRKFGEARDVLNRARASVFPVSLLRHVNAESNWGLVFDEVPIEKKIDKGTLELRIDRYCAALWQTNAEHVSLEEVLATAEVTTVPACPHSGNEMVRGKDALSVVGVALRKLIGNRSSSQVDVSMLAAVLRSSIDREWVQQSPWFGRLSSLMTST